MKYLYKTACVLFTLILLILSFSGLGVFASSNDQHKTVSRAERDLLESTVFTPSKDVIFDELDPDTILFVMDDFVIRKRNLSENMRVDLATIRECDRAVAQGIYEDEKTGIKSQTYGQIVERYINLPYGVSNATTYWTVAAPRFSQKTTTLYLTPYQAGRYVLKNQQSGYQIGLKSVFSSLFEKILPNSPIIKIALIVIKSVEGDYNYQISQRALANIPVMISLSQTSLGTARVVRDWNGHSVRSRSGKVTNPHGSITENTKITWGTGK